MPRTYEVEQRDPEVDALLSECARRVAEGENMFWGMTYEAGVEAGIKWLVGERDEHPLEE